LELQEPTWIGWRTNHIEEIMTNNRDDEIRRRAHQIWEDEGRPDGKESEHWERAAREAGGGGSASHARGLSGAAEGSKTERVADDLQSGKGGRR